MRLARCPARAPLLAVRAKGEIAAHGGQTYRIAGGRCGAAGQHFPAHARGHAARGIHRRRAGGADGRLVDDRGAAADRDCADAVHRAALCRGDERQGNGQRLLFRHPVPAAGRRVHRAGDRTHWPAPAACAGYPQPAWRARRTGRPAAGLHDRRRDPVDADFEHFHHPHHDAHGGGRPGGRRGAGRGPRRAGRRLAHGDRVCGQHRRARHAGRIADQCDFGGAAGHDDRHADQLCRMVVLRLSHRAARRSTRGFPRRAGPARLGASLRCRCSTRRGGQ